MDKDNVKFWMGFENDVDDEVVLTNILWKDFDVFTNILWEDFDVLTNHAEELLTAEQIDLVLFS